MNILVDTCIWSLALRRKKIDAQDPLVAELSELIHTGRIILIGAVRQEILSGIPNKSHFNTLQKHLSYFPDFPVSTQAYEEAARYYNILKSKGVQGSNTDFLLCAISILHEMPLFTTDRDFQYFQAYLPLRLYRISH